MRRHCAESVGTFTTSAYFIDGISYVAIDLMAKRSAIHSDNQLSSIELMTLTVSEVYLWYPLPEVIDAYFSTTKCEYTMIGCEKALKQLNFKLLEVYPRSRVRDAAPQGWCLLVF